MSEREGALQELKTGTSQDRSKEVDGAAAACAGCTELPCIRTSFAPAKRQSWARIQPVPSGSSRAAAMEEECHMVQSGSNAPQLHLTRSTLCLLVQKQCRGWQQLVMSACQHPPFGLQPTRKNSVQANVLVEFVRQQGLCNTEEGLGRHQVSPSSEQWRCEAHTQPCLLVADQASRGADNEVAHGREERRLGQPHSDAWPEPPDCAACRACGAAQNAQ